MVAVTLDGVRQNIPIGEAIVMKLAEKGLGGNTVAAREFFKIKEKVAAEENAAEERTTIGSIRLLAPIITDCDDALEKLKIVESIRGHRRIHSWVVEAALARDGGLASTKMPVANRL
jgi:hypothetical protein